MDCELLRSSYEKKIFLYHINKNQIGGQNPEVNEVQRPEYQNDTVHLSSSCDFLAVISTIFFTECRSVTIIFKNVFA